MPRLLSIAAFTLGSLLLAGSAHAQSAGARAAMGQCVDRVLSGLARSRTPEAQAGRAVVSQCDRQLREALQEAIRLGQAPLCSVDMCMGFARSRAAGEATSVYRRMLRGA